MQPVPDREPALLRAAPAQEPRDNGSLCSALYSQAISHFISKLDAARLAAPYGTKAERDRENWEEDYAFWFGEKEF